jgi:hypothetical protein
MLQLNNLMKQQQQLMEMEHGLAALHVSSSSRVAAAGATPQGPAAAAADAAAICAAAGAAEHLAAGTAALLDKLRCARWTGLMAAGVRLALVAAHCLCLRHVPRLPLLQQSPAPSAEQ